MVITINHSVPCLTSGPHTTLSSASCLVNLASNEKRGNFIVADNNVKTGDVLLVEKPVVSSLLHTHFGTHCLHCMSRLVAPYACPDCAGVAFCSLGCRDTACATYHRFECKFLDLLIGSGMSVLCFLALRMVAQCASPAEAVQKGRRIVADLCGHSKRRPAEDYLRRSVMAAFLLSILQKSGYFGQRKTESGEYFTVTRLFTHRQNSVRYNINNNNNLCNKFLLIIRGLISLQDTNLPTVFNITTECYSG